MTTTNPSLEEDFIEEMLQSGIERNGAEYTKMLQLYKLETDFSTEQHNRLKEKLGELAKLQEEIRILEEEEEEEFDEQDYVEYHSATDMESSSDYDSEPDN